LCVCIFIFCISLSHTLRYVVHQFAKVLPNNPAARRSFVQSRGLARIQELRNDDKNKFQVCSV
jgi:hypothetical protein